MATDPKTPDPKTTQPRRDNAGPADKGVHDGPSVTKAPLKAVEPPTATVTLLDEDLADNGYELTRDLVDDNANKERYFVYNITPGPVEMPAGAPYGNNYVKGGKYTAAVITSYNGKPYAYGWAASADEVRQLALGAKLQNLKILGIARLQ